MKKIFALILLAATAALASTNASLPFNTNTLKISLSNFWSSNAPEIGNSLQAIGFGGSNGGSTNFFNPAQMQTNTGGQVTIYALPSAMLTGTVATANLNPALATLSSNLNSSLTNASGQTIEQRIQTATNSVAIGSIAGNLPAAQITGVIANSNLPASLAALSSNLDLALTNAGGATIAQQISSAVAGAPYISDDNAIVTNLALRQGSTDSAAFSVASVDEAPSLQMGFDAFGNLFLDPGLGSAAAGLPGVLNIGMDSGGGIYPITINRTNGDMTWGMNASVLGGVFTGSGKNINHLQSANLEGHMAVTNLPFNVNTNNGPAVFSNTLTVVGTLYPATIQSGTYSGTNNWTGDLAFPAGTVASLANGNNAAMPIGDATYLRVSGPTAPFALCGIAGGRDGRVITVENTTGYAMTLANNSGLDPVAANRILTSSGFDLSSPASPWIVTLIYDGAQSRWVVKTGQASANVPFVPFNSVNQIWLDTAGSDTNAGTNAFSPVQTISNAVALANRLGGARINAGPGTFNVGFSNVIVSNNIEIAGAGRYATYFYNGNTNAVMGFVLYGTNIYIHDCWIGTNIPGGIYFYPVIPSACSNVDIFHNVIAGNSDGVLRQPDPFRSAFHSNVWSSSYITIEDNDLYSGYDTVGNPVSSPKIDDPCGWFVRHNRMFITGDAGFAASLQTRGVYWLSTNAAGFLSVEDNSFYITNTVLGSVTTGIHIAPIGGVAGGSYYFRNNTFAITNTAGTNATPILALATSGTLNLVADGVINPAQLSLTGAALRGNYVPAGGVTTNLALGTNTLYFTNGVLLRVQ